jgi:hypothetical protein
VEELPRSGSRFLNGHNLVAGYPRCFALADNRLGNAGLPITVDHESRVSGQNRERIECVSKLDGNRRRTDIPRNMPL